MTNIPSVGGVSLGKIPLLMSETIDSNFSDCLKLETARKGMQFQGGQVYIPIFKRLSMKTGMNRLKNLGSLPAMITNLLIPDEIHKSTEKEKEEVSVLVEALDNVRKHIQDEIKICRGNNCIRQEFYFESKLSTPDQDWTFPEMVPWSYCSVSDQNSYFTAYNNIMEEVTGALTTTFRDKPPSTTWEAIPLSAKKMLILCSEMAVSMTEFFPFYPKTMNQIKELVSDDNEDDDDAEQILFHVTEEFLEPLDQQMQFITGLKNGLKAETLYLPEWTEETTTERLSPNDLGERSKEYIQVYLNNTTEKTPLMNHYIYIMGKFVSMLWYYQTNHTQELHTRKSILELPRFEVLAQISRENKIKIVEEATKMVANTYDFEWWWIVKQRLRKFGILPNTRSALAAFGGADQFPTTKNELQEFLTNRPDLNTNPSFVRVVYKIGEIAQHNECIRFFDSTNLNTSLPC